MKVWVIFERLEERSLNFVPRYRLAAADSVAKYGGRYKTVSFTNPVVEGPDFGSGPRMIGVKEFDSREQAELWYHSADYETALAIRRPDVTNRTMIIDVSPPAYAEPAPTPAKTGSETPKAWVIFERLEERSLDFVPEYRKVAAASVAKFGGRYRTVSFTNVVVEGPTLGSRPGMISIIEFASRAQAEAWYGSADYGVAIELRRAGVTNRTMIIDVTPPAYAADAGAI